MDASSSETGTYDYNPRYIHDKVFGYNDLSPRFYKELGKYFQKGGDPDITSKAIIRDKEGLKIGKVYLLAVLVTHLSLTHLKMEKTPRRIKTGKWSDKIRTAWIIYIERYKGRKVESIIQTIIRENIGKVSLEHRQAVIKEIYNQAVETGWLWDDVLWDVVSKTPTLSAETAGILMKILNFYYTQEEGKKLTPWLLDEMTDVLLRLDKREALKFMRSAPLNKIVLDNIGDFRLALMPWMDRDMLEFIHKNSEGIIEEVTEKMLTAISNMLCVKSKIEIIRRSLKGNEERFPIASRLFSKIDNL